MSKLIINGARADAGDRSGYCKMCGGVYGHSGRCPFNNGSNYRIEDDILLQYYGKMPRTNGGCGKTALGLPTPGKQMSISGANGHLRLRPVSSLRCIRDRDDGKSPMMCLQLDAEGNAMAYDSVFEMLESNVNHY